MTSISGLGIWCAVALSVHRTAVRLHVHVGHLHELSVGDRVALRGHRPVHQHQVDGGNDQDVLAHRAKTNVGTGVGAVLIGSVEDPPEIAVPPPAVSALRRVHLGAARHWARALAHPVRRHDLHAVPLPLAKHQVRDRARSRVETLM